MIHNTKIISLGHNCSIAKYLKEETSYRSNMFAFDNMFTWNIPKLCNLLEENGNGVFEKYDIMPKKAILTWVVRCQTYDIASVHDAPLELAQQDAITLIKDLKVHSIKTLVSEIANNPNHIYFLRTNRLDTKLEDSVYLHEILSKIRKDKPFTLFLFQKNFNDGSILNSIPNVYFYDLISLPGWNSKIKKWSYTKEWVAIMNDVQRTILKNAIPLF